MIGPCLCGDIYCTSCGPAQGNYRCSVCGVWQSDGWCENTEECGKRAEEFAKAEYELIEQLAREEQAALSYMEKQ